MLPREIATHAVYNSAADTAQALADTYAELAASVERAPSGFPSAATIKAVWEMAAEIAEDYALKARTKAHDG